MKIEGSNYKNKTEYIPLIGKKSDLKAVDFGILRLKKGRRSSGVFKNKETAVIILSGKIDMKAGNKSWRSIGKRKDVFSGKAYAFFVPPACRYEIRARSDAEIAVCSAPSRAKSLAKLIRPSDVRLRKVGMKNFRRNVYDIIDERTDAQALLAGETINAPGNWSSYPPHKHDVDNLPAESKLEEMYFFKLSPSNGFGVMRVYDNGKMDNIYVLKNNDIVTIPKGYHPVSVIPGYRIYYLWVLAGKKRVLKPNDDPSYSWVKEVKS